MTVILLMGIALLGIAAALGARALSYDRVESTRRLRSIGMYGFRGADTTSHGSGAILDFRRLAEVIGHLVTRRSSRVERTEVRRELMSAGLYDLSPEAYYGYRVMGTFALSALLLLVAVAAPNLATFLGVLVGALLGWRVPMIVVERRGKARRDRIDRELPELMDLLVVSVEAGVGLGGALQNLANRTSGPLGEELRLMQQEQAMGLSGDQAMTKMLERCDTPSVRSFVRSVQQGERLGVSIGTILRNLAKDMRLRRRQIAEERAQKAPIKMLFPLVFLIFPSIFIVLLGPAYFAIRNVL
jgi:tight adherence protein C